MRGLKRRIEQLEYATGVGTQQGIQVFLMHAGAEFALDMDRCAEILVEAGFLQTGAVSVLDFLQIPHGLAADELASYLREHGQGICSPKPRGYSAVTASRL
jgi:hypothetical protein